MTTSGRTLNVGLIGFGLGGATFHAPFITRTPGLRLASIVTSNAERKRIASAEYRDAQIFSDVDALFETRPDLVAISTPNVTHYPLARRALESGAHVVVDKPFAATSAQAREIGELARRVGRLAIPFQNRRWDGDYLTLRSLIADGRLGDVHRFESRFDRWRPVRKPGWCLLDAAERAENVLHDLHTHLIDQALQLFGPVSHVYAEVRRIDPHVVVADDALIALTHASGVRTLLESTMAAGVPGPRYHVYGTKGAYLKHGVDVQEPSLKAGARPGDPDYGEEPEDSWGILGTGETQQRVRTHVGDYSPFYRQVASAILVGTAPPVLVPEVVAGLEIIEAAFRSSAARQVIAL